VLVYPIDKWILMLLAAGAEVRNLGDVRWLATEDGSVGKGTGVISRRSSYGQLEPTTGYRGRGAFFRQRWRPHTHRLLRSGRR